MARTPSPVETAFQAFIAEAVTPLLRDASFRKSGLNYYRRWGDTSQVINIQLSRSSTWTEKEFFINVGIAFDAICVLAGIPVLDRPKEYECSDRGIRDRIEELIPGVTPSWIVRFGTDMVSDVTRLRVILQRLIAELEPVRTPSDYRTHRWFDRFRPARLNAQILYVIGDLEGASQEVHTLAQFFADRQNANRKEWWIEQLCLRGLQSTS